MNQTAGPAAYNATIKMRLIIQAAVDLRNETSEFLLCFHILYKIQLLSSDKALCHDKPMRRHAVKLDIKIELTVVSLAAVGMWATRERRPSPPQGRASYPQISAATRR